METALEVAEITLKAEVERHRVEAKRRELRRKVDLATLRRLHQRFPRLIPEIAKMMSTCTPEDLESILGPGNR